MAFDSLTDKLNNIFRNLRGKGRLTEADVKAALREVKMALLEADVNFKVVRQFTKSILAVWRIGSTLCRHQAGKSSKNASDANSIYFAHIYIVCLYYL